MSRLLRLYPRAWRARYGAELAEILGARQPSVGDRFDLARGAFDAHLHPELVEADGDTGAERDPAAGSIAGGLLIGAGSLIWIGSAASIALSPPILGGRDASAFALVAVAGVLLAAGIGRLVWSSGPPGRIAIGLIAVGGIAITPMTWPLAVVGYWGMLAGLFVVALNRGAANRWPGWLAAALSVGSVLAVGTNVDSGSIWLAVLPPTATLLLAVLAVFRRLPTETVATMAAEGGRP